MRWTERVLIVFLLFVIVFLCGVIMSMKMRIDRMEHVWDEPVLVHCTGDGER